MKLQYIETVLSLVTLQGSVCVCVCVCVYMPGDVNSFSAHCSALIVCSAVD